MAGRVVASPGGSEINQRRAKKLYEVEKLWAAAFSSPKEKRAREKQMAEANSRAHARAEGGKAGLRNRRVHSSSTANILSGLQVDQAVLDSHQVDLPSIHAREALSSTRA